MSTLMILHLHVHVQITVHESMDYLLNCILNLQLYKFAVPDKARSHIVQFWMHTYMHTRPDSQTAVQASCGCSFLRKLPNFSYVALKTAHLSRPYSTFWMATLQIRAKSLMSTHVSYSVHVIISIEIIQFYLQ